MIERKFDRIKSVKLFGYFVLTSDDEEWKIANPRLMGGLKNAVNIYEYFEEQGYDFSFSAKDVLYFRRKKQK